MIDIFTKYIAVVPLTSKSEKTGDITSGLLECLNKKRARSLKLFTQIGFGN